MSESDKTPKDEQRCPLCGAPMVERKRRYDGHRFLGCENFPKCRGAISTTRKYSGHRKDFELAMGRPIKKGFLLHHRNGNENDNRPENLVELTSKQHAKLHAYAKKTHKEWGWSLETSTTAWMSQYAKPSIIVVSDEQKVKMKKLCEP